MRLESLDDIGPVAETDRADMPASTKPVDHFVERGGERYAGAHILLDLWGARGLDRIEPIEDALRRASAAAGATVLSVELHHFSPNQGVSGVALLAESHLSIHTWPEHDFAAIDIFMCGDTRPMRAVELLRELLRPERAEVSEIKRGRLR